MLALGCAVPAPWLVVAALVGGGGAAVAAVTWETALQRHVPGHALSRVAAYDNLGSYATVPLGQLAVVPVAAAIGPARVATWGGVLFAALALAALLAPSVRGLAQPPAVRAAAAPGRGQHGSSLAESLNAIKSGRAVNAMRYIVAGDATGEPTTAACAHLDGAADVQPSTTDGCEDCLREGTRWVHLRECLGCGHVGCCDNSPRRHATAHWRASGHPLVRSFEPGEDWAWCYPDELFLLPAQAS